MAGDHEGGDVGAARILIGSIFVLQRAIMAAVYSLRIRGKFVFSALFVISFSHSDTHRLPVAGGKWNASEEEREKERMWAVVAEKVENNSAVLTTAAVCRAIAILLDLSLLAFFLLQSLDIECCCCCSAAASSLRQAAATAGRGCVDLYLNVERIVCQIC